MKKWSRANKADSRRKGLNGAERPRWRLWVGAALLSLALAALYAFRLSIFKPPWIHFVSWSQILGELVVIVLAVFLWVNYLRLRCPTVLTQARLRRFAFGLILVIVLLGRAVDLLAPYLVREDLSGYLIPAALGAGLATIFLDTEVGFSVAALLALLVGLDQTSNPVAALIAAFGGSVVAVIRSARLRKLSDLGIAGFEIGLINLFFHGAVTLAAGRPELNGAALLWSLLNGIISASLILVSLPLAERLTQKTSSLGLVELLSPSHPLLVLLHEQAPGTYHHSANVADLAERAAQAIGANPLLASVGGQYHDIGKIRRPEFFTENQQNGVNPHDALAPNMSKMVLTSHVKDGIALAREYGLREDIIALIPQHHGTSVIRYFYLKALREQGEGSPVSINDYRYDADLPQTKEAAILMLADSVEAASHSVSDDSHLEQMVEEAIRDKLNDGQLVACPLTFGDLARIKLAFCQTLQVMRHRRGIAYPKATELKVEAAKQSGLGVERSTPNP
jgi:putative nucleotidyltransferase with HDIG domain